MEQWNSIRQQVLQDGVRVGQIERETGLHHPTIKKTFSFLVPRPISCPAQEKSKLGPYLERIAGILQAERDDTIPRKQRHTAKRIFDLIREEGVVAIKRMGGNDVWLANPNAVIKWRIERECLRAALRNR